MKKKDLMKGYNPLKLKKVIEYKKLDDEGMFNVLAGGFLIAFITTYVRVAYLCGNSACSGFPLAFHAVTGMIVFHTMIWSLIILGIWKTCTSEVIFQEVE